MTVKGPVSACELEEFDWSPHLAREEELLWQGRPGQGFYMFTVEAKPIIGFAVVWCAMTAFFMSVSVADAASPYLWFLWLAFALVGLHFLIGIHIVEMYRRRRQHYAITDRNVLIHDASRRKQLTIYPIAKDTKLAFRPGSLLIGPNPPSPYPPVTRGEDIPPRPDGVYLRMMPDAHNASHAFHEAIMRQDTPQ